jgi:putative hydrolase of the HAD superfamily
MTLTELGVTPGQSIHVGDHVKNDVVGARQIGMKTIWIEGFYEREDVNDPASRPDATVSRLGDVVPAVLELLRDQASR